LPPFETGALQQKSKKPSQDGFFVAGFKQAYPACLHFNGFDNFDI
jgi:hypothetical protein